MKSGIDLWVALALGFSVLASLFAGVVLAAEAGPIPILMGVFIVALGGGLPAWMLADTCYRLEDDHLVAKSGPFRWRVPYRQIRDVQVKRTMMAGPALSMDRLVIDLGPMNWLVISPKDRDLFRQVLVSRLDLPGSADTGPV